MRRRPRSCLVVYAATLAGLLGAPAPALAHPFGPPPTAQITVAGRQISVAWSATPDDAVAIGEQLGVMPPGSVELYRQEAAAQAAPSAADEARLSASAELRDYLLANITAAQAGQACGGSVPPVADFVHEGAQVVLTCPEPVAEVELQISMLHDIHPAYRTVAVASDSAPAQSVFTLEAPRQTWRFGAAAAAGPGGVVAVLAGLGLVALVGGAALLLRRRAARRA